MELDLEGKHARRAYQILASLVTPRPIAWVTTLGPDGVVNAAPFSFFNVLGANPPILGFCPGDRDDGTPKDTARNIRLSHEFVVNLVDEKTAEAMNRTATSLPYGVSEIQNASLTTAAEFRCETSAHRGIARESGMCRMGHAANWRQPADHRVGEARTSAR